MSDADRHQNLDKQNLVVSRVLDAPVERVWKAWTDPEDLMRWWGPIGFTAPVAKIDFRVGGTSLVCMSSPFFGDLYSTWLYLEIVPLERFDYIHNLADDHGNAIDPSSIGLPADFPRDQRHSVTFRRVSDRRTELTVVAYDGTVGTMMESAKIGLGQSLDKMAALLAKTKTEVKSSRQ